MSIISSSFLFLFLPLSVILYYLIPAKKSLYFRNLFLVMVSLFFYAWGEPCYVFLLLFLMVFVYFAGRCIDGKRNTVFAKVIVFITVAMGVGVIVFFRNSNAGKTPLGMSFFVFFAVSYMVDIYRGKCKSPQRFLDTALYLSVFFKVTQGPIIEYHQFQGQAENRRTDCDSLYRGVKRFLIGFAKKTLIVTRLGGIVTWIFSDGFGECSVVCAWLGCIACLVDTYIDFSAYSDMACGMALLFGFQLPENFNFPYISTSVTEYWQRWHMTLIQWFRDYLYYPIMLGPSVRFRKFLLKHGVGKKMAKRLQNILVPACVWIPTALWHGAGLNYLLWGIFNCAICVLEMKKRPSQRFGFKDIGGWIYTALFLMFMMPLLLFDNIGATLNYYGTMFGIGPNAFFDDRTWFVLKEYGASLAAGLILCFPVGKKVSHYLRKKCGDNAVGIVEDTALLILSVLSVAFAIKSGSLFFIYQMY